MKLPTGTLQGNWKSPRNSSMIFTARHLHLQRDFSLPPLPEDNHWLWRDFSTTHWSINPRFCSSRRTSRALCTPFLVRHFLHVFPERDAVRSPFSTFLEKQCFCYILFDHLCSYTCYGIARDPHRLSDFLRGCQRMSRESWRFPGKRKEEKQT